ncbi:MAG: protein kinase [Firmicutes bacterium]|nr:protein kinase [Bacillota bacterium]
MKCPQCGINNRDNAQYCLGCGRKLAASPQLESIVAPPKTTKPKKRESLSPQTIQKGRYLVIQKLGAGGMSRVYLARDTKMDCNVVVKEMFPPKNYPEKKEYFLSKFKNEAKLLFRMRHPGIPRVTDYFAEGDNYYMVMEYIEGENMDIILKNRPDHKITADEFFGWMGRLLEIIQFLHNQDPPIYHRDIKPANFMLDSKGQVFLVDFGVAKAISLEEAHTRIGTIGYASPEHFTGKFVKSSDLYSLAASFHFMLSGDDPRFRLPFDFPPISVYRQDLPGGVEAMLVKMLEKDSLTRFQDTESLREEFLEIFKLYKEKGVVPSPPPPPKPEVDDSGSLDKSEMSDESDDGSSVQRKTGKLSIPILKRTRRIPKPFAKKSSKDEDTDFVDDEPEAPAAVPVTPLKEAKKEQEFTYEIKKPPVITQKPAEERKEPISPFDLKEEDSTFKPVMVIKHPEPAQKKDDFFRQAEKQEPKPAERPVISQVSTGPKTDRSTDQLKTDKQSLFSSRMGSARTPVKPGDSGYQGTLYQKPEESKKAEGRPVVTPDSVLKPVVKTPVISISKTDLPERPKDKDKKKQKQMNQRQETVITVKDQDDEYPSEETDIPEARSIPANEKSEMEVKNQEESSKIRMMTFIIVILTVLLLLISVYMANKFFNEKKKPSAPNKTTMLYIQKEIAGLDEAGREVSFRVDMEGKFRFFSTELPEKVILIPETNNRYEI